VAGGEGLAGDVRAQTASGPGDKKDLAHGDFPFRRRVRHPVCGVVMRAAPGVQSGRRPEGTSTAVTGPFTPAAGGAPPREPVEAGLRECLFRGSLTVTPTDADTLVQSVT
jgi:hypothetical protein